MSVGLVADIRESTAERYEAIIRIANVIRSSQDPQHLFEILLYELGKVIQFDAIVQFDQSANKVNCHLRPFYEHVLGPSEEERDHTLEAWVYREQQPVILGSIDGETRFPASMRVMHETGLQSVCAFPLTTAHRRLGSILIASARPDAYSPEDVRFFGLVADQIALATDDALNFRASQEAQERLQLLLDLTNRVVSNLDLREVMREISAQIRRVMQCDGVGVAIPSLGDGKLRIYAMDIPDAAIQIEEDFEPPADDKISAVFRSEEAMVLSQDEIRRETPRLDDIRSLVHVPLKGRAGTVGVLSLGTYRAGAFCKDDLSFLTQVAHQVAIAIENARAFEELSDQKNKLTQEKVYLEDEIRSELNFDEIVGRSEGLRKVLEQIETVAPTDSTVLIYGETGSGKELIARAVHNLSSRKSGAFVKLNCAAIPTGLLESELFGHERGAFTGAIAQRVGRFELAHRGTIFLDEIGEVPLEL
ncbi:MAG TPA: sigma 54-interacting transcriptional regulator, partial [Bryobacteraceae bacterium]|nr:sigma 54-interacting transcriptional regulator [Bryobacteraceae bacterium]